MCTHDGNFIMNDLLILRISDPDALLILTQILMTRDIVTRWCHSHSTISDHSQNL